MEVKAGKRTFMYNNIPLADPDVKLSVQQVRDFYANIYPEITTAEIDGPENKGGDIVYTFRRAVGTKGAEAEKFESWAIVELFGHQQIAGRVTEASIGGASFLRVDVPEQPAMDKVHAWDSDRPAIPAYTRFFGGAAIYALNPCSEEAAKRAATNFRARPPIPFDVPARPALPPGNFMDAEE